MRLFWSLQCLSRHRGLPPRPGAGADGRRHRRPPLRPGRRGGGALAPRRGRRCDVGRTRPSRTQGFVGTYFAPPPGSRARSRRVGDRRLGGRLQLLPGGASRLPRLSGALAVAYFKEPGLPAGAEEHPARILPDGPPLARRSAGGRPEAARGARHLARRRGGTPDRLDLPRPRPRRDRGRAERPGQPVVPGRELPAWTLGGKPVPVGRSRWRRSQARCSRSGAARMRSGTPRRGQAHRRSGQRARAHGRRRCRLPAGRARPLLAAEQPPFEVGSAGRARPRATTPRHRPRRGREPCASSRRLGK